MSRAFILSLSAFWYRHVNRDRKNPQTAIHHLLGVSDCLLYLRHLDIGIEKNFVDDNLREIYPCNGALLARKPKERPSSPVAATLASPATSRDFHRRVE